MAKNSNNAQPPYGAAPQASGAQQQPGAYPQQGGYPQQAAYPPPGWGYPPPGWGYPPPGWGYPQPPMPPEGWDANAAYGGYPQQAAGWGDPAASFPPPFPGATQAGFGAPHGNGLLGWLGNRQMEQFILGLLLGGAATYVLADPEKRARLIRMGMKLYAGVAGSFEEFKEQVADLKAEVAAEHGDPDA